MSQLLIHLYVILTATKVNYCTEVIPIEELSKKSSFLETAYLLIWGELPTAIQLRDFEQEVQMHRRLSFRVRDMMKCFPATGHPMDALQSSAASLGLFYSRRAIDDPN